MTTALKISIFAALAALAVLPVPFSPAAEPASTPPPAVDSAEVLVYPTKDDGSVMHWLCISPLPWNAAYIGDSMSYDVFKRAGQSELTIRPRAGAQVLNRAWRKMTYNGTTEGASMCGLFDVAGFGFNYGVTVCVAYIYSPTARPNAVFAGSSDDALKVILNGAKVWSNQIQRSPTYDSDQCPAPLRQGWNTLVCVVDQIIGGHLLCARFLDGDKGITDLEIALDPPAANAVRHPAAPYNQQAADLIRAADAQKADGKFADAIAAYDQILAKFPLADVAPRAAYARASCFFSPTDAKSLGKPAEAVAALEAMLGRYGQDLLAEYAVLDLAAVQETGLKDVAKAVAIYASFETQFPLSSLAPKAAVEQARMLAAQGKFEDAILICRKVIKKYPKSDEVMTATLRIADAYRLAGDQVKAKTQYAEARKMAQDWHDNKYGVDVGKQAWLQGLLEEIRKTAPK